jgi:hypothetical protein
MDVRYAQKIVEIAKAEAQPPEYGKVNDFRSVPGEPNLRFGWERLKQYFEEGANFHSWGHKGMFQGQEITALDGVKLKGKRVPQRNQGKDGTVSWSGTQWCGIFAAWCWKQAKVPGAYWAFPGVKAIDVKIGSGKKRFKKDDIILSDLGLGDIAVLKDEDPNNPLVHHCIVSGIYGQDIEVVNGNSDYQGITIKKIKRDKINYFYTVKSDFLEVLRYLYGDKPAA